MVSPVIVFNKDILEILVNLVNLVILVDLAILVNLVILVKFGESGECS